MKTLLATLLLTTLLSCGERKITHIDAKVEAEIYVREKLQSPSTAVFGNTTATKVKDSVYSVIGSVDAQNAFGGVRRAYWNVEVEFYKNDKIQFRDFVIDQFSSNPKTY